MVKNTLTKCVSLSLPALAFGQGLQLGLQKHRLAQGVAEIVKRDGVQALNMDVSMKNSLYSVQLDVGTPPQKVTVAIDTGSSDFWVVSSQNPFCTPGTNFTSLDKSSKKKRGSKTSNTEPIDIYLTATLPNDFYGSWTTYVALMHWRLAPWIAPRAGVFDSDLSSTFKKLDFPTDFAIQYLDGSQAQGIYFTDSFLINGILAPNITGALAMETDMTMGILGLSFEASESSSRNANSSLQFTYPNFLSSLKNSGVIAKVAYSLFLNSLEQSEGSLLFGAVDHSLYQGQLYTVPLINIYNKKYTPKPIEFDVTVNGVGLVGWESLDQKKTLTQTKFPALLDSGSQLTMLPPGLADEFADSVGAIWNENLGYYVMPCPTQKQVEEAAFVFDFNGAHIYTPISNFVLTTADPNACLLGIVKETSNGGIYNNYGILGDNVLSSMYTVFDLEDNEVSIAQASHDGLNGNRTVEDIVSTVPGAIKAPDYYSTWTTWEPITGYTYPGRGIFTNEKEVNPWVTSTLATGTLSTSSFSISSSPVPTLSPRSSSAFSKSTADSTTASSFMYSAPSSVTTLTSATSTPDIKYDSISSIANTSSTHGPVHTVSASDAPNVASKHVSSIVTTKSAQKDVSTVIINEDATTLVTITSCKSNACFTTTRTALVSVATKVVEGTLTEYTTYCPLTFDSPMLSGNSSSVIGAKAESTEIDSNVLQLESSIATDSNATQLRSSAEMSTSASFSVAPTFFYHSSSSQTLVDFSTSANVSSIFENSYNANNEGKATASTEVNGASTAFFSGAMLLAAFALGI
ncbi:hypothetical protein ACO0QE_002738 [Hanseniaspora vineae]